MKTTIKLSVWKKLQELSAAERERRSEHKLVLCKFINEGKCREEFIEFRECIERCQAAGEPVNKKCMELGDTFFECCRAHKDYYWPVLEKDVEVRAEFFEQLRLKYHQDRRQFFEDLKKD